MKTIRLIATIGVLALLAASASGVNSQGAEPADVGSATATVAAAISYQGRLVHPTTGAPLSGTYDLEFTFWSLSGGGSQIGATVPRNAQLITNGLYSTQLEVDPANINGQELWLQIRVRTTGGTWETLTPRVQVLPTAYAMSLRPGARIEGSLGRPQSVVAATNTSHGFGLRGESRDAGGYGVYGYNGNSNAWSYGAGIIGSVLASGYGVVGTTDSGHGVGVQGVTEDGYAVMGVDGGTAQARGYGGYFVSANGVGVYGYSGATSYMQNVYTPGVYGRSANGVGVYGSGPMSGVRGESSTGWGVYGVTEGDTTNDYGVYGRAGAGTAYGVYGYKGGAAAGLGVHGRNDSGGGSGVSGYHDASGNGTWGYSVNYNGVGGGTGRVDNNYGLYTADNLYSLNFHTTGAVMQVVQNGDAAALERGDVVVIAGMAKSPAQSVPPLIQVRKAREANSASVLGVVASTYAAEWLTGADQMDPAGATGPGKTVPLSGPGPIAPGEYLLVVVQGPCQVKVDAVAGAIRPGDLLSSAGTAGNAAQAATVSVEGVKTAAPGTVLGKALEPLVAGQKLIYVFVTLQ